MTQLRAVVPPWKSVLLVCSPRDGDADPRKGSGPQRSSAIWSTGTRKWGSTFGFSTLSPEGSEVSRSGRRWGGASPTLGAADFPPSFCWKAVAMWLPEADFERGRRQASEASSPPTGGKPSSDKPRSERLCPLSRVGMFPDYTEHRYLTDTTKAKIVIRYCSIKYELMV